MLLIRNISKWRRIMGALIATAFAYLPSSYAQDMAQNFTAAPSELQQYIQRAFLNHPRLTAAIAEHDVAKAEYAAADKAIYNPELEFDGQKTTIETTTIELSQTIDWGDQQGAKTAIARHKLNAAQAILKQQKQQLLSDLLNVLTNYKNKTRLANLSQQRLALMKNFADVAKLKHSAGDLNQVALDLAQLAYSESIFNNAKVLAEQVAAEQDFYALYNVTTKKHLPNTVISFEKVNFTCRA